MLIIFILSVLVVIGLVLHLATNAELNKMKYPDNGKKKKDTEIDEFELPFRN